MILWTHYHLIYSSIDIDLHLSLIHMCLLDNFMSILLMSSSLILMLSTFVTLMMTNTWILDDLLFYYYAFLNHNDDDDLHYICIDIILKLTLSMLIHWWRFWKSHPSERIQCSIKVNTYLSAQGYLQREKTWEIMSNVYWGKNHTWGNLQITFCILCHLYFIP